MVLHSFDLVSYKKTTTTDECNQRQRWLPFILDVYTVLEAEALKVLPPALHTHFTYVLSFDVEFN